MMGLLTTAMIFMFGTLSEKWFSASSVPALRDRSNQGIGDSLDFLLPGLFDKQINLS